MKVKRETPAPAGSAWASRSSLSAATVYPRDHGGGDLSEKGASITDGVSPQARGCLIAKASNGWTARCTPAGAGFPVIA